MIAVIKYNAGNIGSVQNALNRLSCEAVITDNAEVIKQADKVIFPGVGEASSAMRYLKTHGLDAVLKSLTQPVLGICLGLQLMCKHSEEGNTNCLPIFDTTVKRFPQIIQNVQNVQCIQNDQNIQQEKIPHIGWNNFENISGALFKNVEVQQDVYYVHSYYAEVCEETLATCNYIVPFSAAMQKDNFYATQFHPEKSAAVGAQLLKNFLAL